MNRRSKPWLWVGFALAVMAGVVLKRRRDPVTGLHHWVQVLREKHGAIVAGKLAAAVRPRYTALLAGYRMPRHSALRWHLREKILPGLALYQILLQFHAGNQQAALDEVAQAFRHSTLQNGRLMYAAMRAFPPPFPLFRLIFPLLMKVYPAEGWDFEYVVDSNEEIAFNASRCFYLNTLNALGAGELTASFCATDDVMGEQLPPSICFVREHTLGRGDAVCDFQYYSGSRAGQR